MYAMLILAAVFGLTSGFLGNYLSVELAQLPSLSDARLVWPTGPMVVVVASAICLLSLMFAPERGFFPRFLRIARFRYRCMCENLLKAIWRKKTESNVFFDDIIECQTASRLYLRIVLWRLQRQGWISKAGRSQYRLTQEGERWAARIVRLHRLWEVYLAHYLGVGGERVHRNAEEMEHIITPQIERELTLLLNDPKRDPHHQPIPPSVKRLDESL